MAGRTSKTKLAAVPNVEHELDELYGAAPADFTAARNDLAARLKRSGQTDMADAVRSLPKPTLPVWAANQLARRNEQLVQQLIDSGNALQRAQIEAIKGKGTQAFHEANERERAALQKLTEAARPIMAELGRPPTEQAIQRLSQTLRAASTDDAAQPLLAQGRLARELDASGFDAFAGTAPALRPTRGKTQRKDRTAELKARLRDIKQREKEQAATVRAAEREQAEAEAAAAKAQARTQAERTGADAVAQERKAIERELQDAREDRSARAKHDVVHGD